MGGPACAAVPGRMATRLLLLSASAALLLMPVNSNKEPAEVVNDVAEGKSTGDAVLDEKIERYLKLLEKRRDAINKFLQENYSDFNHSDYTPEEYVSHPINAYMLMKRTSIMWQMAKPVILDTSSDDLWREIEKDLKQHVNKL